MERADERQLHFWRPFDYNGFAALTATSGAPLVATPQYPTLRDTYSGMKKDKII